MSFKYMVRYHTATGHRVESDSDLTLAEVSQFIKENAKVGLVFDVEVMEQA